jgi:hyperosmotically inducible periplasmic protein
MKWGVPFALLMILLGSVQGSRAPEPQQRGSGNQARLTNEVRHQLVMLPYYSVFDNLEYQVNGNVVTLLGQVTQPYIKDDAAKAVKGLEGVETVDNQIQVLPLSSFDDRTRRAEFQSIYSFSSLQRYSNMAVSPIHIIVANGHVTLEGVVDTQGDKDAAGIRAKSVPNVFSVTNNLRVQKGR